MFRWIMDRMVARAIPPDLEDPAQERIAEEAAENAIRQVVTVAGIAGVFVFAAIAALLYGFLPTWQNVHGASQPSAVASRVETEDAKRLQAKEESEGKLQEVVTERDALQDKVADLEQRLEELAKRQPQVTEATAASQDPTERERLQSKVGGLERQVADRTQKLQATRAVAVGDRSARDLKPARPRSTPVSAEPWLAYRCGDGRTVRNPATCKATGPVPPGVGQQVPDTYYCGDGRSVMNPAVCGAAVAPPLG